MKKENREALLFSIFGGAFSIVMTGYIGVFGFAFMGIATGISVGIFTRSKWKGIAAATAGAAVCVVALIITALVRIFFDATILSVIISGILVGGTMGFIAGYEGRYLLKDSWETTAGGMIGGVAAFFMLYYAYYIKDEMPLMIPFLGIIGGAVLGGGIILSAEIAYIRDKKKKGSDEKETL